MKSSNMVTMRSSVADFTPRELPAVAAGSLEDTTLIWRMDVMRDLFKVQRMWPSFIGAKDVQRVGYTPGRSNSKSNEEHLLPILLWPEQKRYLALQGLDGYGTDTYHIKVAAESEGLNKAEGDKGKDKNSGKRKKRRTL